jgi:hypothetical protein
MDTVEEALNRIDDNVHLVWRQLTEIRDYARSNVPPETMNMTIDEWNKHRLNRIAYQLSLLIGEGYYKDDDYE